MGQVQEYMQSRIFCGMVMYAVQQCLQSGCISSLGMYTSTGICVVQECALSRNVYSLGMYVAKEWVQYRNVCSPRKGVVQEYI